MAEDSSNRNQEATPHKLKEARRRGQMAKSADVVSAVVFAVAVVFLNWRGWDMLLAQFRFDQSILLYAGRIGDGPAGFLQLCRYAAGGLITALLPFFLTVMLAAVLANILQTGPNLSLHPLKPDLERVNPVAGLKRLLSMRTLFELLRALLKLSLLVIVAYQVLKAMLPRFFLLGGLSPRGYLHTLVDDLASMGLKIAMVMCFIAMVDLLYTRREFARKMRMSTHEMKEEVKQREGDPRIRSRLRRIRMEMRKRSQAVTKTRSADVVITNPTHIAVALRYEHGKMDSPLLVAKGAGLVAAVMRRIAARHHIPVVQNKVLARKLFHQLDFNQHVPAALYADVARIIVWVFAMRQARQGAAVGGER